MNTMALNSKRAHVSWPGVCSYVQVTANWAVLSIFGKDKATPIEDLTPFYYTDARDDWSQQLVIVARNNQDTPCLPHSSD